MFVFCSGHACASVCGNFFNLLDPKRCFDRKLNVLIMLLHSIHNDTIKHEIYTAFMLGLPSISTLPVFYLHCIHFLGVNLKTWCVYMQSLTWKRARRGRQSKIENFCLKNNNNNSHNNERYKKIHSKMVHSLFNNSICVSISLKRITSHITASLKKAHTLTQNVYPGFTIEHSESRTART